MPLSMPRRPGWRARTDRDRAPCAPAAGLRPPRAAARASGAAGVFLQAPAARTYEDQSCFDALTAAASAEPLPTRAATLSLCRSRLVMATMCGSCSGSARRSSCARAWQDWLSPAGVRAVPEPAPAVHFVGFRANEYWSAVRIWGPPAFIHRRNDPRMRRELHPTDTIVFANGAEARPVDRNSNDLDERP
jgi:hypothetical protein